MSNSRPKGITRGTELYASLVSASYYPLFFDWGAPLHSGPPSFGPVVFPTEPVASPAPETCIGWVEGWRWWRVKLDSRGAYASLLPMSLGGGEEGNRTWVPANTGCECIAEGKVTLTSDAGLYAYMRPYISGEWGSGAGVIGRVALYGDVVEHTHGYRAEKARVLEVWVRPQYYADMSCPPFVVGTYEIVACPSPILQSDGITPYEENRQCLKLENRRESPATSLWSGRNPHESIPTPNPSTPPDESPNTSRTWYLPIKTRSSWWGISPRAQARAQYLVTPDGHLVAPNGTRPSETLKDVVRRCPPLFRDEIVLRPDISVIQVPDSDCDHSKCPACGGSIGQSDVVAVAYDLDAIQDSLGLNADKAPMPEELWHRYHLRCAKSPVTKWLGGVDLSYTGDTSTLCLNAAYSTRSGLLDPFVYYSAI